MEIRSITAFTDVLLTEPELALAQAANFLHNAESLCQAHDIPLQTKRVATQPFPRILAPVGPGLVVNYAARVQEIATDYGIDYLSLGPVHADDDPDFVDAIPDLIAATESVFFSISLADPGRGIDLALARQAAAVIQQVSQLGGDGMQNLRLAALANVPAGAPFFPAAYHAYGEAAGFALAVQSADLALAAFSGAASIAEAGQRLTEAVNAAAARLLKLAEQAAADFDLPFLGLDFSLAPYPDDAISLAGALERLGVLAGGGGAAAAASVIMTALDAADFPRVGFNGLMLPVLEDSVLAARAADGRLSVTDLLLYSAICGTGLDTLPLPGDVAAESLAGMLLDTAALALRLDKPLTARLMPLPGKVAGDPSELDQIFSYFAPSRVMAAPEGLTPGGLFMREGAVSVTRRARSRRA